MSYNKAVVKSSLEKEVNFKIKKKFKASKLRLDLRCL